jgi:hypothetical protein
MATTADIVVLVEIQLSSSSTLLTNDGLTAAVNYASIELGWNLPETDPTRIMWLTKRGVRHACNILFIASAQAFKYKQVNLQHRFDHYDKLIKTMDNELEAALSSQPTLFSSVEAYKQFGTALNAGFIYDSIGQDLTYTDLVNYIYIGE